MIENHCTTSTQVSVLKTDVTVKVVDCLEPVEDFNHLRQSSYRVCVEKADKWFTYLIFTVQEVLLRVIERVTKILK